MILDMVAQDQCCSTRGIARELGVEHRAVHLILQDEDLYPYHCSWVQGLMAHDYRRLQYCEWLLREHERDPDFLEHILWSDEAAITREGVFNSQNSHLWAQHNPQVIREWGHQVLWSIDVWAGIIGNCVVSPYLLPDRLNGLAYCVFLQEVLPVRLEDVPLAVRCDMWFQHDGAPAHFRCTDPTAPQHTVS
jgi:hypothetical protein